MFYGWSSKLLLCGSTPNEVLIFGGSTRVGDEKTLGYRFVRGGRSLRVPARRARGRMDLSMFTVNVNVSRAYSKGGIPLNVHGVANVKLPGEEPLLNNAIERFLGRTPRGDLSHRQGDAGGQPARRARPAHARGGEPGQARFADSCSRRPSTT